MLAFRRIYGSHSGENQPEVLIEVINEYGIGNQLGYFVSDNHGANDSAVRLILAEFLPRLSAKEVKARSLRCIGHIVNLAAQSLLAATDTETKRAREELGLDHLEWQGAAAAQIIGGQLGKPQRLISYVLASSEWREKFGDIKGPRKTMEFDHLAVSLTSLQRWYRSKW